MKLNGLRVKPFSNPSQTIYILLPTFPNYQAKNFH